jgi:hypothetical protein
VVGSYGDLLNKFDKQNWQADVDKIFTPAAATKFQLQGQFVVSVKKGDGISELKAKIAELALQHPKIAVGKVNITQAFTVMQAKIREQKSFTPYLYWQDYLTMAANLGIICYAVCHVVLKSLILFADIPEEGIQEMTGLLHTTGNVLWHNTPKLRDIVILDPQWFADAAAAVCKAAHSCGVASWAAIREALKAK